MYTRDAAWAVQQHEAVRSLLPNSHMPTQSIHASDLGAIADHFDVFLLDAFGVLNVGETAINSSVKRVQLLKQMNKRVLVLTNGACFPVEQALRKFLNFGFSLIIDKSISP